VADGGGVNFIKSKNQLRCKKNCTFLILYFQNRLSMKKISNIKKAHITGPTIKGKNALKHMSSVNTTTDIAVTNIMKMPAIFT
jgi:hypothetical protein